jgi:hypothetical protein
LIELSNNPRVVKEWHADVTKQHGPVGANHSARVLRARSTIMPPSLIAVCLCGCRLAPSISMTKERAKRCSTSEISRNGWKAWRQIESTTRQAYHLTELLTETRLGELARLRRADVKHNEPNLVVGKAKAGQDIVIPVSNEIAVALQMARDDAAQLSVEVAADGLVFPGCSADLAVDDLLVHFLMGHAPESISQKYIAVLMLSNGPAMRATQERISARMVMLLGLTAKTFIEELRKPPQPRPHSERKPINRRARGQRKREDRSDYFKRWYAKNQRRIFEKRRAERLALKAS